HPARPHSRTGRSSVRRPARPPCAAVAPAAAAAPPPTLLHPSHVRIRETPLSDLPVSLSVRHFPAAAVRRSSIRAAGWEGEDTELQLLEKPVLEPYQRGPKKA
ncbi:unnamed protein product, partial [Urochloa humidicola]